MRQNLTERLNSVYFNEKAKMYYVLNDLDLDSALDNPDGRLTNDLDLMLTFLQEFFFGGIQNPDSGLVVQITSAVTASIVLHSAATSLAADFFQPQYGAVPLLLGYGSWLLLAIPFV